MNPRSVSMARRPLSITIIAVIFIVTGAVLVASIVTRAILGDGEGRMIFDGDFLWAISFNLAWLLGGIFLLLGRNWARWLLVASMAAHIVISAFNPWTELLAHIAIFTPITYLLFRPPADDWFRSLGRRTVSDSGLHPAFPRSADTPELKWLECYSGESVDQLIDLHGKYRTDSIVIAFEQAMDQKAARIGEENLAFEERMILAIEALERDVNNGGYGQFFVNSSRAYSPMIVDALRRIGCHKTADLTQRAIDIITQYPISDEERTTAGDWRRSEPRRDALHECDKLYYQAPDNIEESLFSFIKNNRHRINP